MHHYLIPNWPAAKSIKAFCTTRQLGHSKEPYQSFNLAYHTNDDPDAVTKNRLLLQHELNLALEPSWLEQAHGSNVVYLDRNYHYQTADASFTDQKQITCVVLTADCLPILLADIGGKIVAAIHGGWRSLAAGIIENTLFAMRCKNSDLLAWLGPAICAKRFEVGNEVRDIFIKLDPHAVAAFVSTKNNKWLMDLSIIATQKLQSNDVANIFPSNDCTYCQTDLFYSYRRDGANTGRMATMIWIDG